MRECERDLWGLLLSPRRLVRLRCRVRRRQLSPSHSSRTGVPPLPFCVRRAELQCALRQQLQDGTTTTATTTTTTTTTGCVSGRPGEEHDRRSSFASLAEPKARLGSAFSLLPPIVGQHGSPRPAKSCSRKVTTTTHTPWVGGLSRTALGCLSVCSSVLSSLPRLTPPWSRRPRFPHVHVWRAATTIQ